MKDPMPTDIFKIGQVLNNTYEIIGILGRGGTGEVYLARNQINDREIAIKALNARFSGNADYVELMKREDQMRAILHDAVVRYVECSRSDQGHVFLVMDYIDGPSLNDVMLNRRVDDRELLIVAHRVLEGLVPTHAHEVVHRDLSPDNIILRGGRPEKATIIDFGIAKDTSAGAMTIVGNEFAGKYEYAAPEQLDGRADPRTDLYALGASLLAAHRREVPYVGSNPAEIVRNKAEPLDTDGVREPLKGLIEWLSAPRPEDRPRDAQEALDRVAEMLKPSTKGDDAGNGKRSKLPLVLGLGAFAALGVGLWASGVIEQIIPTPLPVAETYTLRAELGATGAELAAHAPDEPSAELIAATYGQVTGQTAGDDAVTLAAGMPREDWVELGLELMRTASALDRWDLDIESMNARLSGLAASGEEKRAIIDKVERWSDQTGMPVALDVIAGPEQLPQATVQSELDRLANCGRLEQVAAPESYAIFDAITIRGDLADAESTARVEEALKPLVGDRTIRMDTVTLNEDLCAIRAVLPIVPTGNISISLSNGATGQAVLTGVFQTGENPVADVLLPGGLSEGSLWVMVVDNTGKVFHILPNIKHPEHSITALGTVENGVRRVRVLWSIAEMVEDRSRLAMQVTDTDYGKSEIVAILSRKPLFDMRRPRDESVRSVSEALAKAVQSGEAQIIGVASRILEARP